MVQTTNQKFSLANDDILQPETPLVILVVEAGEAGEAEASSAFRIMGIQ
jgi:hypothetical protein